MPGSGGVNQTPSGTAPIGSPSLPPAKKPLGLIIAVAILALALIGALVFGFWAFAERADYKNNSEEKVAAAVEVAKKETTDENNKRFAEESKNPLKTYTGPSSYGSVKVQYPKTWSAYIDALGTAGIPFDAYFHPDFVPATQAGEGKQAIALRVQVSSEPYDQVLGMYDGGIQNNELKASPYALPKMPEQVGMKFVGKLSDQLNGTEIVLPLRDKTLIITTETDNYLADFNKHILANLTFVP